MNNNKNITLLDCTLRDGSYTNNFQFTARDTVNICAGLEQAGIKYIEVGHGLGIGINKPKLGIAFETDLEYVKAAYSAVEKSKIGAFFIPELGDSTELKNVIDNSGLDFVRIGVNVNEINKAKLVSETLLSEGIEVHLNLMKTYAIPSDDVLKQLEDFRGLDLASIYVVDSAGGMLPSQVHHYVKELTKNGWQVGFHGHNNLELANANCLTAVHAGAKYIDGTLSGVGRSAGNAQTEVLSWIMNQAGYPINVDTFILFEIIEKYIKQIMTFPKGSEIIDVVIGMSKFHSGYLPLFKRVIGKYDVNIYRLIQQVSEIDCMNPSEELITSVAKDLSRTDV